MIRISHRPKSGSLDMTSFRRTSLRIFGPFCAMLLAIPIAAVLSEATLVSSQTATGTPNSEAPTHQPKSTIEGLVRDIACPIQNVEATATHLSMKCLRACAKAGSPLVILTKDGELYVPISEKMPDEDQRQKLAPFLGKYVRASGTVYERKGTHAIAISEVEEMNNVHLTVEDQ
jgi:hypothetical protein